MTKKKKTDKRKRRFVHEPAKRLAKNYWDAMVVLPEEHGVTSVRVQVAPLLKALEELGYSSIALTHSIYGPPKKEDDAADQVMPADLWKNMTTLKVYRRLHVVVETVSTLDYFSRIPDLGYDLLSFAPRNEACFRAACAGPNAAKIITLDYTVGGENFGIRSIDVKSVVARNVALELTYAPAVLHRSARKALMRVALDLQSASAGLKPMVILSSGERIVEGSDAGELALRSAQDVRNLATTVLRWDHASAVDGLSRQVDRVLQESRQDCARSVTHIEIGTVPDELKGHTVKAVPEKAAVQAELLPTSQESAVEAAEDNDDGFIAF